MGKKTKAEKRTTRGQKDFVESLNEIKQNLPESGVASLRKKKKAEKEEKAAKENKLVLSVKENRTGFYDQNVVVKDLSEEDIAFLKEGTDISESEIFSMSDDCKEFWKDVPGYKGYYQISNMGNARSVDRYVDDNRRVAGKVLKINNDFYQFSKNGTKKAFNVFYLMGITFYDENETNYTYIKTRNEFPEGEEHKYRWLSNLSVDKVLCMVEFHKDDKEYINEFNNVTDLMKFMSESSAYFKYDSLLNWLNDARKIRYSKESDSAIVSDYEKEGITVHFIRGKYKELLEKRILKKSIIRNGLIFKDEYLGIRWTGKEIERSLILLYRMEETEENSYHKALGRRLFAMYFKNTDYPLNADDFYVLEKKEVDSKTFYSFKNVSRLEREEKMAAKDKNAEVKKRKKYFYLKHYNEYVAGYSIQNKNTFKIETTSDNFTKAVLFTEEEFNELLPMLKGCKVHWYYIMVA